MQPPSALFAATPVMPPSPAHGCRHRRLAIAGFVLALAMLAASIAALAYTFASGGARQWPAIAWQVCQLLAILSFVFGLWHLKKHRERYRPELFNDPD